MNLTPAQLTDLRGIVAERIGAPEITEDRMICPKCGGDDYGPSVLPNDLGVWWVDNRLPLFLVGVCTFGDCGHVQEPASRYVIEATTDHVRELWEAPDDWVLWLHHPMHVGEGLPSLAITDRREALRPFIIAEHHHIAEMLGFPPPLALDEDIAARVLPHLQKEINDQFPPF